MLKNSPFTWFDKLTTGFDKHVLSEAEGLRANGACVENIGDFPFMLSLSKHEKSFFSNLLGKEPFMAMPSVGEKASDFSLPVTRDQKVGLGDFLGKKNVVLAFYPLDFTGG